MLLALGLLIIIILGDPSSVQSILSQPIFLNSNIQYKKSSLIFPRLIKNNILFICDIVEQGSLKSRNDLVGCVGNYALLTFVHNALINASSTEWVSDISSTVTLFRFCRLILLNKNDGIDLLRLVCLVRENTNCNYMCEISMLSLQTT